MGAETKITVTLPTDLVADLEAAVAAGDHASLDAAIQAALEETFFKQFVDRVGVARLRASLEKAEAGPTVDGESVARRLMAKYAGMAKADPR